MATPREESSIDTRRLERALTHVSTHWLPINEAVLTNVRKGLTSGAYDLDPAFLINDLKNDFGLFTLVIRELQRTFKNEPVGKDVMNDPIKLIRWAGPQRIMQVLGNGRLTQGTHSLDAVDQIQAGRLRETVITASTAELLSEAENLNADSGYAYGVIRQLGLNLIAWNYPALFARALKTMTVASSLDKELTNSLGFSPTTLAMALMHGSAAETETTNESYRLYQDAVRIGEALARASEPETYPSAEHDWANARQHVERHLGQQGLELIEQRIHQNTEQYRVVVPDAFKPVEKFHPGDALERYKHGALSHDNPFLKHCSPDLKTRLKDVYTLLSRDTVSKEPVELLLKKVFPTAGFTGACVFVFEPSSLSLVPRAKVGTIELRDLRSVPVAQQAKTNILILDNEPTQAPISDLAAAAFACDTPLVERMANGAESSPVGIYGVLGRTRRVGVLYLEAPQALFDMGDTKPTLVFKALRHALMDCLHVL